MNNYYFLLAFITYKVFYFFSTNKFNKYSNRLVIGIFLNILILVCKINNSLNNTLYLNYNSILF